MTEPFMPIADVNDDTLIDTGDGVIRLGDLPKNVPGLPYLNAQIDEMLSQQDSVLTIAQEFMRDTSIPLEDRWNIYLKVEKLLPISSYCGRAIDELVESLYDDLFPDGRGVRWNSDIDESLEEDRQYLEESLKSEDPHVVSYAEDQLRMISKRDKWREAVLQEQQGLVVFDW